MSFVPADFMRFAEKLMSNHSYDAVDEARLRTVVSRSYYYVFLSLRESFRDKLRVDAQLYSLFDSISKSGIAHSVILHITKRLDYTVGNWIAALHKYREEADYKIDITVRSSKAHYSLLIANQAMGMEPEIISILPKKAHEIKRILEEAKRRIERE